MKIAFSLAKLIYVMLAITCVGSLIVLSVKVARLHDEASNYGIPQYISTHGATIKRIKKSPGSFIYWRIFVPDNQIANLNILDSAISNEVPKTGSLSIPLVVGENIIGVKVSHKSSPLLRLRVNDNDYNLNGFILNNPIFYANEGKDFVLLPDNKFVLYKITESLDEDMKHTKVNGLLVWVDLRRIVPAPPSPPPPK